MIVDIEVRDAGAKGLGVFALRSFRRGEFIFRRRHGRIVPNASIASLSADEREHLCEIDFGRSAVLLGPGRYLNHACDPNAMRSGVKVFAWRSIRKGQEITIDYRLNAFDGARAECLCGSRGCTGELVSSFFALEPERQRLYLPYAPPFIKSEYRRRTAIAARAPRNGPRARRKAGRRAASAARASERDAKSADGRPDSPAARAGPRRGSHARADRAGVTGRGPGPARPRPRGRTSGRP
ncbi:MAG: SET domain-containing protein [Chloroflexi bacterium]|nr:MAG: SET domain-containing protein [Chloroflexota bacterium]